MPSIKSSLRNNQHISLDDVCFLVSVTFAEDDLGQTEIERQIFCAKTSVSRAEFLAAGQLNHKPQMTMIVDADEYDGEQKLKYDGKKYVIYRDFVRADGFTELYCEVRKGVN